jgi:hypothetical protein
MPSNKRTLTTSRPILARYSRPVFKNAIIKRVRSRRLWLLLREVTKKRDSRPLKQRRRLRQRLKEVRREEKSRWRKR